MSILILLRIFRYKYILKGFSLLVLLKCGNQILHQISLVFFDQTVLKALV